MNLINIPETRYTRALLVTIVTNDTPRCITLAAFVMGGQQVGEYSQPNVSHAFYRMVAVSTLGFKPGGWQGVHFGRYWMAIRQG